jgi:hypothetical protein
MGLPLSSLLSFAPNTALDCSTSCRLTEDLYGQSDGLAVSKIYVPTYRR